MGSANEDMDRVRALREERKRLKKEGKFGRKATSGANKGSNGGELRVLFRGTPLTAAEVQAVSTRLN